MHSWRSVFQCVINMEEFVRKIFHKVVKLRKSFDEITCYMKCSHLVLKIKFFCLVFITEPIAFAFLL